MLLENLKLQENNPPQEALYVKNSVIPPIQPLEVQESKANDKNLIRIKLYNFFGILIICLRPNDNEMLNSNVKEEDFSPNSKINFGEKVNTDKSINSGALLRRRNERLTCTTPMGGKTPTHKSAIVGGIIE